MKVCSKKGTFKAEIFFHDIEENFTSEQTQTKGILFKSMKGSFSLVNFVLDAYNLGWGSIPRCGSHIREPKIHAQVHREQI